MTRTLYRLEPLVTLSERGRRIARTRVATAVRRVGSCAALVRTLEARSAITIQRATAIARDSRDDCSSLRACADVRIEVLVASARASQPDVVRARHAFERATDARERRRGEARRAEADAELQRSARERALARTRLLARRRLERSESADALEAWSSVRSGIDQEDPSANWRDTGRSAARRPVAGTAATPAKGIPASTRRSSKAIRDGGAPVLSATLRTRTDARLSIGGNRRRCGSSSWTRARGRRSWCITERADDRQCSRYGRNAGTPDRRPARSIDRRRSPHRHSRLDATF